MATLIRVLEGIGMFFGIAGMIYLQYRRAKWVSDQKSEKADIQTLFSGKK